MKDKPITIAVVDSGVNVPHPHLPAVKSGISFDSEGCEQEDVTDVLGHGTAVTSAIYEKAPDAQIFAVKVFDQQLATSVPTLVRALDWASEHHMHLVNLSLGTPNEIRAYDLAPAVERAVESGTIIVSARANEEQFWYPGCMEGVLGVVLDWEHPRESVSVIEVEESSKVSSGRVVSASGYPRPIPGIPTSRNVNGISFAVANTTGVLAALLTDRPDVQTAEAALDLLSEGGSPLERTHNPL
tara:strand:- start:8592 stop:9317 length:726 start_codon:yes stop_codon:yes gene_type:complete